MGRTTTDGSGPATGRAQRWAREYRAEQERQRARQRSDQQERAEGQGCDQEREEREQWEEEREELKQRERQRAEELCAKHPKAGQDGVDQEGKSGQSPSSLEVACPKCGFSRRMDVKLVGRTLVCPCGEEFIFTPPGSAEQQRENQCGGSTMAGRFSSQRTKVAREIEGTAIARGTRRRAAAGA